MLMTRVLAVWMLLVGASVGQSCPVKFERVRAGEPTNPSWKYYFSIKWKNISEKEIIGAKFQAFSYDAMREPHDFSEAWQTGQKVAPGRSTHTQWDDSYYIEAHLIDSKYAGIRLEKVLFSDGSTWQNDDSGECEGRTPDAAKLSASNSAEEDYRKLKEKIERLDRINKGEDPDGPRH